MRPELSLPGRLAAILLGLCLAAAAPAQTDAGGPPADVPQFNDIKDLPALQAQAGDRLIALASPEETLFGYAIAAPFKTNEGAFDDIRKLATARGVKQVLVLQATTQIFPGDKPPPGGFLGGVYHVVRALPFGFVPMTKEAITEQLRRALLATRPAKEHFQYALTLARQDRHRDIGADLRLLLRGELAQGADSQMVSQICETIVHHEGDAAADDMLKWAKFHKNFGARLCAYKALMKAGRTRDVEEVLRSEPDKALKSRIERSLL